MARNTSKYYRVRTEGEKAADETYKLLVEIERQHSLVRESHKAALKKAGESPTLGLKLSHLNLESLESLSKEITQLLGSERDTKARARLGSVMSQLFHAYTSTGQRFHSTGLADGKLQDTWLPGYQGVSDSRN